MAEVDATWVWGIALIAAAVGIGVGIAIAYAAFPWSKRARKLEKELEGVKESYDGYRGEVNQHFVKTSELFQEMTDRYRAIYEHMASGAQALCRETPEPPRLDLPEMRVLPANPTTETDTDVPGEIPAMRAAAANEGPSSKVEEEEHVEEVEANGITAPPQAETKEERPRDPAPPVDRGGGTSHPGPRPAEQPPGA